MIRTLNRDIITPAGFNKKRYDKDYPPESNIICHKGTKVEVEHETERCYVVSPVDVRDRFLVKKDPFPFTITINK